MDCTMHLASWFLLVIFLRSRHCQVISCSTDAECRERQGKDQYMKCVPQSGDNNRCEEITCSTASDCLEELLDQYLLCVRSKCQCREGYYRNKHGDCVDKDECLDSTVCPSPGVCENLHGSYKCSCPEGYRLKDGVCEDIDECRENLCEHNCVNLEGTYVCSCRKGFTLHCNKQTCIDIDECIQEHPCDDNNGGCTNKLGSYSCHCHPGWYFNTNNTCEDINECTSGNPCEHICQNTLGGYTCSCNPGYQCRSSQSQSCVYCEDINECAGDKNGGCSDVCSNLAGSYECKCCEDKLLGYGGLVCNVKPAYLYLMRLQLDKDTAWDEVYNDLKQPKTVVLVEALRTQFLEKIDDIKENVVVSTFQFKEKKTGDGGIRVSIGFSLANNVALDILSTMVQKLDDKLVGGFEFRINKSIDAKVERGVIITYDDQEHDTYIEWLPYNNCEKQDLCGEDKACVSKGQQTSCSCTIENVETKEISCLTRSQVLNDALDRMDANDAMASGQAAAQTDNTADATIGILVTGVFVAICLVGGVAALTFKYKKKLDEQTEEQAYEPANTTVI